MSLVELGVLGFAIGLTGALAPGPTLIATIQSAIRHGWMSGPRITGGHIIAEFLVVLLIATGISFLPDGSPALIAGIGGVSLIIFGSMTLRSAGTASLTLSDSESHARSPVIAGLVTSVSNPYFWIWWFSVGGALLVSSLTSGLAGLVAFITGHWLSDLSWFTFVSVSVHKSRVLLKDREYRYILTGCGVLLIVFGIWFIYSGFSLLTSG
jgi:threonine/homoserine/homoserine lactone efflux protein